MEILQNIIMGAVQGLTEFLPVSSSGHVKLLQHLFNYQSDDNLFVSVMLHLGTLLAVFLVYHSIIGQMIKELFLMIRDICTGKFRWSEMNMPRRLLVMEILSTGLLGFMIIPLGQYSLKDYIEMLNNCDSLIPLGFAFLVTGMVLIFTFRVARRQVNPHGEATVKDALIIGGAQCVATVSGISRSGSTVAAGLLCGLDREYMLSYSFILGIPAILGAAASDAMDAMKSQIQVDLIPLLFGIAAAVVFGVLSIKMIQWLIRKDRYNIFGYYCGVLGLAVIVLSLIGVIH